MECQGLMFHSFLYVKIVNYAEFLPVFLDTIEEIKKQDFQKKEI